MTNEVNYSWGNSLADSCCNCTNLSPVQSKSFLRKVDRILEVTKDPITRRALEINKCLFFCCWREYNVLNRNELTPLKNCWAKYQGPCIRTTSICISATTSCLLCLASAGIYTLCWEYPQCAPEHQGERRVARRPRPPRQRMMARMPIQMITPEQERRVLPALPIANRGTAPAAAMQNPVGRKPLRRNHPMIYQGQLLHQLAHDCSDEKSASVLQGLQHFSQRGPIPFPGGFLLPASDEIYRNIQPDPDAAMPAAAPPLTNRVHRLPPPDFRRPDASTARALLPHPDAFPRRYESSPVTEIISESHPNLLGNGVPPPRFPRHTPEPQPNLPGQVNLSEESI